MRALSVFVASCLAGGVLGTVLASWRETAAMESQNGAAPRAPVPIAVNRASIAPAPATAAAMRTAPAVESPVAAAPRAPAPIAVDRGPRPVAPARRAVVA